MSQSRNNPTDTPPSPGETPRPPAHGCASFWGPFRPVFGGHTLEQVATSYAVPALIVSMWRLAFATFLGVTLVSYLVDHTYAMHFYSAWCHLGLALAFAATGLCSAVFVIDRRTRAPRMSVAASCATAFFQVFATSALFLDVVYWAILFDYRARPTFAQLAQHAFNLAFVAVDLLLTLRVDFRVPYAAFFVAYTLAYLGFAWIRFAVTEDWVYDFLDYRTKKAGIVVAYYFGILAWALLAAAVLLLISRIGRCVSPRRKTQNENTFNDEEAVAV